MSDVQVDKDPLVSVPKSIIELHWQLTNTREWPTGMMQDIFKVQRAYSAALEGVIGNDQSKQIGDANSDKA